MFQVVSLLSGLVSVASGRPECFRSSCEVALLNVSGRRVPSGLVSVASGRLECFQSSCEVALLNVSGRQCADGTLFALSNVSSGCPECFRCQCGLWASGMFPVVM